MNKFLVENSMNLKGEIEVEGAKNSALPILASCILTNGVTILENIPFLADVYVMINLLESIGINIYKDEVKKTLTIDTKSIFNNILDEHLIKKIRASFLLAGPLLARFGEVSIQMPGGCSIGVRPIDLHLKGFKLLGAKITKESGLIKIKAKKLKGSEIYLDFPSVGATENLIMTACFAEGTTTISNCAIEPEIVDLAEFINKLGGKVVGAGTDTIKITGVKELSYCKHSIIPDRIEAGTFLVAGAITKGQIKVKNVNCEHLKAITSKLKEINVDIKEGKNSIEIYSKNIFKNIDIKTMPYPGFPTDMQPQFMSLMATSNGSGVVNESVFENRFLHVSELNLMGADIKVEGRSAFINGVKKMSGTKVKATDLRAGAGLIIASLFAEGKTEISDIYHIERGYYKIEEKLQKLGAKIKRI